MMLWYCNCLLVCYHFSIINVKYKQKEQEPKPKLLEKKTKHAMKGRLGQVH